MEDEDYEVERTLCQLPSVHVFKVPVRMTAEGHRAADWPKDPVWTGKLKITSKGKTAFITLFDDKNPSFAVCIVNDDSAVERTLDSGRYFVLRITNNTGRHAFIGIAFNERNDAFDFNVALSEHKKECEREASVESFGAGGSSSTTPQRDLSLKEGEKISIKIGAVRSREKKASTGSGGLLAPPPSGGGPLLSRPPKDSASGAPPVSAFTSNSTSSTTSIASVFDSFGQLSFTSSASTPTPASKASEFSSSTAPKSTSGSSSLLDFGF